MRRQHGFTLVEILVAVIVTALLLTTIYGVFISVSEARRRIEADSEIYHRARVIFDRIGREIHGTYWSAENRRSSFAGGLDEQNRPFLELSTTTATPQSGGGGIVLVRYLLRDDPENEETRELVRLERPLFTDQFREGNALRLASGITGLSLRFYSAGNWQDSWDATGGGLPQLIEFTLTQPSENGPVTFSTTFGVAAP